MSNRKLQHVTNNPGSVKTLIRSSLEMTYRDLKGKGLLMQYLLDIHLCYICLVVHYFVAYGIRWTCRNLETGGTRGAFSVPCRTSASSRRFGFGVDLTDTGVPCMSEKVRLPGGRAESLPGRGPTNPLDFQTDFLEILQMGSDWLSHMATGAHLLRGKMHQASAQKETN